MNVYLRRLRRFLGLVPARHANRPHRFDLDMTQPFDFKDITR